MKLTDRLLTDEFTVGGIWSGNADFKDSVPGNLTYSYSNNQLHVEFVHTDFVIGEVFETFYGLISRGEIVTLINARVSSTKGSNVQHTKIVADSMIIDSKPISNVGSFSHREINFTYTNMGDWFGINPWNQTRENNSYYYEEPLLKQYKIEGIILGCTEIDLLINSNDRDIPLFDTTECHINAISQIIVDSVKIKK